MVTKFTSDSFPNTHIEFTSEGVKMILTLNISKKMCHYLSPNNIVRGKKFFIYTIAKVIKNPSRITVINTYEELLKRAMINCRNAKIAIIENEKLNISERKLFY